MAEVTPSPLETLLVEARADRSYARFYGLARRLRALGHQRTGQPLKLALLGDTTLEHLVPYLEVHLQLAGFVAQLYVSPYGQYRQEVLNESSRLYSFAPDVVILLLEARAQLGDDYDFPQAEAHQRRALIRERVEETLTLSQQLLARTRAQVILHELIPPLYPLMGILDAKEPYGALAQVQDYNQQLFSAVQQHERLWWIPTARVLGESGITHTSPDKRRFIARIVFDRGAAPLLASAWERIIRGVLLPARKVLVLDLDNTLWGGVIGEDGLSGIQLGHDAPGNCHRELQRIALSLSQRGVVLAICSKNNLEDAMQPFREHPGMLLKESHFAAIRCNWQEKALNLRELAEELSLGLDSFVFVDDNPVERAKVREALPEVWVVELPEDPALYAQTVAALPCFETPRLTAEDRQRGQLYVQRRQTEALRQSSASLDEFLFSLQTQLRVEPVEPQSLGRAAQLLARTNQFNMTTRRHTEADLQQMLASPQFEVLAFSLSDRFGAQGQVGLVILQQQSESLELESYVLSCRVLGRGVEKAIVAHCAHRARQLGKNKLRGLLRFSKKNAPARELYRQLGFVLSRADEHGQDFELDLLQQELEPTPWIELILTSTSSSTSTSASSGAPA
ncbi:MAG: HAD-IIIC family phosphatase [Myxococcota bacterium]